MQRNGVTSVAMYNNSVDQSELLATSGDGGIHIWNYSIGGRNLRAYLKFAF